MVTGTKYTKTAFYAAVFVYLAVAVVVDDLKDFYFQ
jgi:hypothetical protein